VGVGVARGPRSRCGWPLRALRRGREPAEASSVRGTLPAPTAPLTHLWEPFLPTYTTSTGASALLPTDTGPLVIQPMQRESVFAQIATRQSTSSRSYRVPVVVADPAAAWVSEGAEITPADPTLQELLITPSKVAGLSVISREMADDSDPTPV
jgi:HK97 family phage major capsid protein